MAIKSRSIVPGDGCQVMNLAEFKRWLKKFDSNGDERISKEEFSRAIRANGHHFFTRRMGREAVVSADSNHDGFIEDDEVEELVEFARRHLGIRIIAF